MSINLNIKVMYVKINTRSNYRELNGRWLRVTEKGARMVTCVVQDGRRLVHTQFNLMEDIADTSCGRYRYRSNWCGRVETSDDRAALVKRITATEMGTVTLEDLQEGTKEDVAGEACYA